MERRFIFVYDKILIEEIYADLSHDERVIISSNLREVRSKLMQRIRGIHLSERANRLFDLPMKWLWSRNLNNIRWDTQTEYYVIFVSSALYPISAARLLRLQKKYHIHYLLLMMDDWNSFWGRRTHEYFSCINFEYVLSFDPRDASEHGFIYVNIPYSMLSERSDAPAEYDLFYIGTIYDDTNRLKMLLDIYGCLQEEQIHGLFMMTGVKESQQKYADQIIYNKRIPYASAVEQMKKTNCILEIMKQTQSGATLRYYEAVCYNKKLLTNNIGVKELPFYDPRYIKVFEKPEDIDWDWVREQVLVDFHYDGRYAPTRLIDKIIELEEGKEGGKIG